MKPALAGVGLWLALVQFVFALGWTVYALYLPQLMVQAGLPKAWAVWVLLLDQLVFLASDLAMGVVADRTRAVLGKLGRLVLGMTLVSALAFLLLPWAAPQGSPALLMGLTLLWALGSSALRAPPLALVGRHAARPQQATLVALHALGLGLAAALAPFLTLALRAQDPRLPFALASLALAAATLGVLAAEKTLARQAAAAAPTPPSPTASPAATPAALSLGPWWWAVAAAALGFQLHVNVNSAALYKAVAAPAELATLAAVFWVGFNLTLWPAGQWARRSGPLAVMGPAALGAALAAGAAMWASSAQWRLGLVAAQYAAGCAWALLLVAAFAGALALGRGGHEGRASGWLNAVLAGAALLRLGLVGLQWPQAPAWAWAGVAAPVAAWLLAAPLLRRASTMPGPTQGRNA